ncbi:MAG TPA: hypothetical protein VGD62_07330 [Acidobacteriaceae bacterium]
MAETMSRDCRGCWLGEGRSTELALAWRLTGLLRCAVLLSLSVCSAAPMAAQQTDPQAISLSPTRPTVANSATIQTKGVLQVETGYDAYPQNPPGNQQTLDAAFFYAPLDRLRLDFLWSAFEHQQQGTETTNGVGTVQLGGKVVLKKEDYHLWAPGVSVQYEAELPTASQKALQGYGQQAILLINHHYGPDGDLDVIANGSVVQSDCQTVSGCSYGGQQSFALSYHLNKETRLYAEAFAQNVSQSNTPPGTYVFGGFFHQFSDTFGVDGGMRFGVSEHSASVGTTVGLVFGRRLRGGPAAKGPMAPRAEARRAGAKQRLGNRGLGAEAE